jgi:hypothetical protein
MLLFSKISFVAFFLMFSFGVIIQNQVYAQGGDGGEQGGTGQEQGGQGTEIKDRVVIDLNQFNPFGTADINEIIARLTRALLGIIGTISFAVFVLSGVRLILARGAEDKITKAKDSMTWALVGLVVALGSYAILSKVFDVLVGKKG